MNTTDLIIKQEQIEFYKENGYLIIHNILSNDEIKSYKKLIWVCANKNFAAIMNPDRFDFLISQCLELINDNWNLSDKLKFIKHCRKTASATFYIMSHPNAVYTLETLQGEKVVGLMSQMLFKKAGSVYAYQAWTPHQDNAYPRNKNGKYITTNFFLEDADKSQCSLLTDL